MKRILILYTSVGLGHKFIALNIAFHLRRAGFQVQLHDVLQLQSGIMVDFGEWLHGLINRRLPFIWRWLYFSKIFAKLTMPFRVPLAGRNLANIQGAIERFRPDLVISTQTSASAPMAYLKRHGLFRGQFVIAFSDYHFHPYWFYKEAQFYLVNIQQQSDELMKLGVPNEAIAVCGITLPPPVAAEPEAVKRKLGLVGKKVVLASSGSLGIGFPESMLVEFAHRLTQAEPDLVLVVTCGKNQTAKDRLENLARQKNLNMKVLGFYEPFAELLAIAELFLTKPGGLTVAEALRDNVPMLITHFLPGQEELNYTFLTERQLVHAIPRPLTAANLLAATQRILAENKNVENPNSLEITQKNHEGAAVIKSIEKLLPTV
jgi:processive 1,2-diacylglycerol beta-glucosyltransferase